MGRREDGVKMKGKVRKLVRSVIRSLSSPRAEIGEENSEVDGSSDCK